MSKVKINYKSNFFHYLTWESPPESVLVITHLSDSDFEKFIQVVNYLIFEHNLTVYVEEKTFEQELFLENESIRGAMLDPNSNNKSSGGTSSKEHNRQCHSRIRRFPTSMVKTSHMMSTPESTPKAAAARASNDSEDEDSDEYLGRDEVESKIDLIVCLGGDGELLTCSSIFQRSCPPVISIHSDLLGFLCPFSFSNYAEDLRFVIKGDEVPLLFRNRLKCTIRHELIPKSLSCGLLEDSGANAAANSSDLSDCQSSTSSSVENAGQEIKMISLNEIVVGRGGSSFICNLELYVNNYLITTIQGDGVIISTPTGTTAYAMAAGASMSHPSIPAIIITPICPHSLSFRPIVVPAGVTLRIRLSPTSRNTAWYSVDGSENKELLPDHFIQITTSKYPLPSICRSDEVNDWFEGLATCLHWNKRQHQLPLTSCHTSDPAHSDNGRDKL